MPYSNSRLFDHLTGVQDKSQNTAGTTWPWGRRDQAPESIDERPSVTRLPATSGLAGPPERAREFHDPQLHNHVVCHRVVVVPSLAAPSGSARTSTTT